MANSKDGFNGLGNFTPGNDQAKSVAIADKMAIMEAITKGRIILVIIPVIVVEYSQVKFFVVLSEEIIETKGC